MPLQTMSFALAVPFWPVTFKTMPAVSVCVLVITVVAGVLFWKMLVPNEVWTFEAVL
jgi:hypothetical protein